MTPLTDRYVAATARSVPAARREEIATELRASIEDMIEGQTAAGQDRATAEREVLNQLGDPAELAARYTNRRMHLIGPAYYLAWERLLKLLLSFVPAIVGVVVALVKASENEPGGAIGAGIGTAIEVAVHIAFWVTLAFVIMERANTPLNLPKWSVDQLPDRPADPQITLTDTATSIGFLALFIVCLPLQHFRSFIPTEGDGNIPILDPALWSFWLPFLIVVLVASAGLEFAKYRAARWTWPLVAVNALLNLAFAVPVVWLLLTDRLLSPEFVARFDWLGRDDNLDRVTTIAAVAIVVISLWDVADSAVKAYRGRSAR